MYGTPAWTERGGKGACPPIPVSRSLGVQVGPEARVSRRSYTVLCAAALLLLMGGCTTWGRQRGASSVPRAETSIPRARLVLRDGSSPLALSDVTVRSDSVTGYLIDQERSRMAFARADLVAVETRVPNHFANFAIVVVGAVALTFGVLFAMFAASD